MYRVGNAIRVIASISALGIIIAGCQSASTTGTSTYAPQSKQLKSKKVARSGIISTRKKQGDETRLSAREKLQRMILNARERREKRVVNFRERRDERREIAAERREEVAKKRKIAAEKRAKANKKRIASSHKEDRSKKLKTKRAVKRTLAVSNLDERIRGNGRSEWEEGILVLRMGKSQSGTISAKAKRRAATKTKSRRKATPKAVKKGGYNKLIAKYAAQHGVPYSLARAVVQVESSFRPNVTGGVGEIGLMQVRLATARGMGYKGSARQLYNPATNLYWGMKYLGKAHRLAGGSTCGTILKYNAGHGAKRMNPISQKYCTRIRGILA